MMFARALLFACVLEASASGATNLLPNGDFDLSAGEGPTDWERVIGSTEELIYASDGPQYGTHCLKLDTRSTAEGRQIQWHLREPIQIEPGTPHRVAYHFRIDESNMTGGQAVYVQGWYLDAEKKRLPWRKVGRVSLNTGGRARVNRKWALRETEFTPPESAAFLDLCVSPGREFRGVVAVDGLRIVKLPKHTLRLPDGALAFDFVPESEKPVPGFTPVPVDRSFRDEGDYGWDIGPGQEVPRSRWRDDGGYPTRLQGTGVRGASFVCALPNGEYVCSAHMGSLWRTAVGEMNHVVEVDRGRVVDDGRDRNQLMDEEYFRYVHDTLVTPDDLERKGFAVHEKYILPRFHRHDFSVTVRNGRVSIRAASGFMNGIVISPKDKEGEHAEAMDALDRQLAEDFVAQWAEFIPWQGYSGDYQPSTVDRRRGYVVFRRHWMRSVGYNTRPDPEEVGTDLAFVATPGEYEPITFAIWPLKDLANVRIEPGALRNEDGATLPADVVRVWFLQHKQRRRSRPCTAYWIQGTFLPDWDVRELFGDLTQRCWLSVKVPQGVAPGIYQGQVRVTADNAPAATLSLSLRVLPFELVRPKRVHVMRRGSNQVLVPYPCRYPVEENDVRNKQFYRQMALRDLHEHGFSPEFSLWWRRAYSPESGRVEWEQPNTLAGPANQYLQLIKDSPFGEQDTLFVDGSPAPCIQIFSRKGRLFGWTEQDLRNLLRDISRKTAEHGFTEVYFHGSAEEGKVKEGFTSEAWKQYFAFVRDNRDEWPNVFTAHTCITSWGQKIAIQEADMTGLGMFHGAGIDGEAQVAMAQAVGRPYTLYGCRGRMVPGFYLWKSKAVGSFHEFYGPYYGTLNNDWDNGFDRGGGTNSVMGEAPGWCNVTYSPTGRMIGSWFWEEMREGVDDDAYLHTLESLLERTSDNRDPAIAAAREAAQQTLAGIDDLIDLDVDVMAHTGGRGHTVYRPIAPEDFDGLRWKVALAILRLEAAIEGQQAPTVSTPARKEPLLSRVRFDLDPAAAGDTRPPAITPTVMRVHQLREPITVDGKLDEACYRAEPQVSRFFQLHTMKPLTPPTTVHLFTDGKTLYVGVRCSEPRMSGITADATRDFDYLWPDDCVEFFIDPGHTHHSYYHIGVNPNGARALYYHPVPPIRGKIQKGTKVEDLWDAKVHKAQREWTVEVGVPLAKIGVVEPCFGMSVCRSAPQHRMGGTWTPQATGSYHQPAANADVYLPGASPVLERVTLGHVTSGWNVANAWLRGLDDAESVTFEIRTPQGSKQLLTAAKQRESIGLTRYDVRYDLGLDMGEYAFTVRAGNLPLGTYRAEYESAFFTASPDRQFVVAGSGRPIRASVELLLAPGASLDGFRFRARMLSDVGFAKEGHFGELRSRRISAFMRVDDLPLGIYDLEIQMLDRNGTPLRRTLSEIEIVPNPF